MDQDQPPRLHVIDLHHLGLTGAIAAYVVETHDGLVMIECGPARTLEAMQRGLAGIGPGFGLGDIRHLLLSHIHFDHAGAAGHLAEHGAHVHVHHLGAKHLADPSRLVASATRIYGDDMDRLWGDLRPVPADRLHPAHDGDRVKHGGLTFRAIETPGHADHHHAWAVELGGERLCFTGDAAAAVCLEAPTFISLPAPPPEFDPDRWRATLERLRAEGFDAILPTHFGRVDAVDEHLDRVAAAIGAHVERLLALRERHGDDEAAILEDYSAWFIGLADAAGLPADQRAFYAKGSVVAMNVSGVGRWARKRAEAEAEAARG